VAAAIDVVRLLDDPATAAAWGTSVGLDDPSLAHRSLGGIAATGVPLDLLASLAGKLSTILPTVADPDRVLVALERFLSAVRNPLASATLFERDPRALDILLGLFSASPHLAELVISDPEAWEEVRVGRGRPEKKESLAVALAAEVGTSDDSESVARAIRRFKRRQTLRIAYGDIVEHQRLETVVGQLSHVAECIVDLAVRTAVDHVTRQRGTPRGPDGRPITLAAIALGKLGGGELNYSSDIDLVFVHSAEGRIEGPRPGTTEEFFGRVVQEVVRLVAGTTDHGAAYRVDLRLRPHGSNGPASMSIDAILAYVDRSGRTWERQAWLKARCVGGDRDLGSRLLAGVEPWVYRRWLTRADISGIKALKRRIEQRAIREGGDDADVKCGRGGIRDVEFTIQLLQLLNGGDTPSIRTGSTLEAIRRLAHVGALTDQEREILERTYTLLRTVEHRLQILYDRQTHTLPRDDTELGRLAIRLGYGGAVEGRTRLRSDLAEATTLNRRILDHLLHDAFPDDEAPEPEVDLVLDPEPDAATVQAVLARHGFADVPAAHRSLVTLGEEQARFLSTRRCRHFLAAIAPRLLAAIGRTPDPDATLTTLASVSDSLGGKGVLWELFSVHPATLDLTVRLCSSSPFLARLLVTNPGMIDELLDSLLLDQLPSQEELATSLDDLCRGALDCDPILQSFKASHQLRVGVRDMLGRQDADTTTAALSSLAECLVRQVVQLETARLGERLGHPRSAEGHAAQPIVLAMGKFGGREMNYASDIDVVFLYDHDGSTAASGRRRRPADGTTNAHFFAELAQHTLRVFNAFGPQGRLYEMDSRLRPSGSSGAAAVSLAEFARYFAPDGPAAIWERQALVKARPVVTGGQAADALQSIIDAATYHRRWTATDVEAIRQMRHRMEEGARSSNLKRGAGGVVDIEFLVQMLQLVHGGENPLLRNTGTRAALVALHAAGHLDADRFGFLERSYRLMRGIEGRLRLLDAPGRHDFPESDDQRRTLAHLLGYADTDSLVHDVRTTTARVRAEFEAVFTDTIQRLSSGPSPRP